MKMNYTGLDLNKDFYDMSLSAGEGNIGHMIEQVARVKDILLTDSQ